ncbi:hypothetical protein BGZ98_003789 [Dissophora globulifera]|nr:hypothetical protein BGZ98_003789 [Dissophora globulifera]
MQTFVALKTIESVHLAVMTDRIRHIQNAGGSKVGREEEAQDAVENVPKARVTIQVEVEEEEEEEEERGERFERLQRQLIAVTGSKYTAEFLLNLTEPVAIHLKSGETENVLALPGGAKRLLQDMVVSVRPVKRRTVKGNSVQDGELRFALAAHAFGAHVDTVSMALRSPTRFLLMNMKSWIPTGSVSNLVVPVFTNSIGTTPSHSADLTQT